MFRLEMLRAYHSGAFLVAVPAGVLTYTVCFRRRDGNRGSDIRPGSHCSCLLAPNDLAGTITVSSHTIGMAVALVYHTLTQDLFMKHIHCSVLNVRVVSMLCQPSDCLDACLCALLSSTCTWREMAAGQSQGATTV